MSAFVLRCDETGNVVGTDTQLVGRVCPCQGCRAADELARLRAENARLVEGLRAAREWFAKAEDSEAGADYLNGDGRTDGSDGWGDADIVAEQISAAIAAAEGGGDGTV